MKIAFKDHPEIFEYPSYEATATIPLPNNNGNATTVLKSTNNAIGSFGKTLLPGAKVRSSG